MPEKKSLGPEGVAGFNDFMRLFNFPVLMLKSWSAISSTELCRGRARLMLALDGS